MNSINDILNQKADDLFHDEPKIDNTNSNKEPEKKDSSVDIEQLKKIIYNLKDQIDSLIRLVNNEQIKNNDFLKIKQYQMFGIFYDII